MARALAQAGVSTVFTLPGGHMLGLLDGCAKAGIRVLDFRHEGAAALAAEGWALATGQTGFAAVTAGPGFTNALTALVDAQLGGVPLVLFAGRTALWNQGRGAVADFDQVRMAASIAKRTVLCVRPERIRPQVADAFHDARGGRPGSVYLEIPADMLNATVPPGGGTPDGLPARAAPPAINRRDLGGLVSALMLSSRPLVLAGSGAFFSSAAEGLKHLAEEAHLPVVTTSAARGLMPDSHPWCVGSLVHAGAALVSADLVIVLGSGFNANLLYGAPPLFGEDQFVVQVDIAEEALGGNRVPQLAITGDVAEVVDGIRAAWAAAGAPTDRSAWLAEVRNICRLSLEEWDRQIADWDGEAIHPGALAREVAAEVRRHGNGVTLVADGGDTLAWALAYFHAEGPGRLLTTTTALGTLGVGLPFALAAQAARPNDLVVLLTGDGAFGLTAMEMDTAVRHQLPIVVVVANNSAWADVAHHQDAVFGPGHRIASRLAPARYDRLAESLGGHGEHVTELAELQPALERAMGCGVPAVVNVETDPEVLSDLLRVMGQLGVM
ncbi:MAG TPA: thiamine pyrophosphate-binding protein [Candidatus Acidoferrales bacterium]|nr:thiamine pyrophosphate-binding protein [Candidatus Acidoferrales bacterium]